MAEYSSRSDELWNFAATLFEEESKSIPFAKQEGDFFQYRFKLQVGA